jgi:hypothetical protein
LFFFDGLLIFCFLACIKINHYPTIKMNTMKKLLLLLNIAILSFSFQSKAQSEIPKDFEKGTVTLANGNLVSGYVKDQIRKSASINFFNPTTGKKQMLDGNSLNAVEINGSKYLCLNGDFFKVISNSEPMIVQKSSDATGKSSYNGLETIINKGTEGKIDDQFQYNSNTNELKSISHKKD